MTKLSEHFTLEEMTQTDTGLPNHPDSDEVMDALRRNARQMESVRSILGDHPIQVESGYRSPKVNAATPSASKTSDHMTGNATDFKCPAFGNPREICKAIMASGLKYDQLILEPTWVHIGFGPRMRQQNLTKVSGGKYSLGIA